MMETSAGKRTDKLCIEMIDMSRSSKDIDDAHKVQREAKQQSIRDRQRLLDLEMMEMDEYELVAVLDQKKLCGVAYAS